MANIVPKTLIEFIDDFLDTVEAETGIPVDKRVGSMLRALAAASATNALYVQALAEQVRLNSRLDTADDEAAESFVNQFAPYFTPRLAATHASQAPLAPTALSAAAKADYLLLGAVAGYNPGQSLLLQRDGKSATCDVVTVQPEGTLLSEATTGDTLVEISTASLFVGASISLLDGAYSATGVVIDIVDADTVQVTPLASPLTHTFNPATTKVIAHNVVAVTNLAFGPGATLGDFTAGTEVRVTNMLQGQRFFRLNPNNTTPMIPARTGTQTGYRVQTKRGNVQYEVVADSTNPNYDPVTSSYKIPANAADVYVRVEALLSGTAQHVAANSLTVMPTPIPGIDGTSNPYPIDNASDQETLAALKDRFRAFIASQGSANRGAVENAVRSVSAGIQFTILENVAVDGTTPKPGNFVILVGDITGSLTSDMVQAVKAKVEEVRALTTTYDIVPPIIDTPLIVVACVYDTLNYKQADVQAEVKAELYNSFLDMPAGVSWNFNDLLALVMDVDGVVDVTYLTVNGNGFDRTGGNFAIVGTGPANGSVTSLTLTRPPLGNITVS